MNYTTRSFVLSLLIFLIVLAFFVANGINNVLILIILFAFLLFHSIYAKDHFFIFFFSFYIYVMLVPYFIMVSFGNKITSVRMVPPDIGFETLIVLFVSATLFYIFSIAISNRHKKILSSSDFYMSDARFTPVIALYLLILALFALVGFENILEDRIDQKATRQQLSSALIFIIFIGKITPAAVGAFFVQHSVTHSKRLFTVPFLMIFILHLIVCNPVNSPRFIALGALWLMFLPYAANRNWTMLVPALFPIVSFVVLPITSLLRSGFSTQLDRYFSIFNTVEFFTIGHFESAMSRLNYDLEFGRRVLSSIFVFVPRALFPNKNSGTGIEAAERLQYSFHSVSIPPVYDFYIDFGLVGAMILCPLLFTFMLKMNFRFSTIAFYCAIPMFIRGSFTTSFIAFYGFLAALFIASVICRLRFHERVRAAY